MNVCTNVSSLLNSAWTITKTLKYCFENTLEHSNEQVEHEHVDDQHVDGEEKHRGAVLGRTYCGVVEGGTVVN